MNLRDGLGCHCAVCNTMMVNAKELMLKRMYKKYVPEIYQFQEGVIIHKSCNLAFRKSQYFQRKKELHDIFVSEDFIDFDSQSIELNANEKTLRTLQGEQE